MEWIQNLSTALRYIDDNLSNEINVDDVSKQVFSSSSNFHRIFKAVTGISIGEYIRNRRLTVAGQELCHGKEKVIDIAMRYGYDTPESFSKAFSRFHGITPSDAKVHGDKLKVYQPLTINITLQGGFGMSRLILENFDIPFSGFAGTSFINCFTSAYMFLEGINGSEQERYFFFFDTMCGRSSLRPRYDGNASKMQMLICKKDFYDGGSDNNIDFLFRLVGYNYNKITSSIKYSEALRKSIDSGKPIIVRLKSGKWPYRIITGYDDNSLICPDYDGAQDKPEQAPHLDEIDALYVFGDKSGQRYTIVDGLKRIRQVMNQNIYEKNWDSYMEKLGTYRGFFDVDLDEKKNRIKRVAETMWDIFNCHNFRETFCFYDRPDVNIPGAAKLSNPDLAHLWQIIDGYPNSYNHTHDLAWGLIAIESCTDWSRDGHASNYLGPLAENTIAQIAQNDKVVLDCIEKAIAILEKETE